MSEIVQQRFEESVGTGSGTSSLINTTGGALRRCFDGGGCENCGACCIQTYGFEIPSPNGIRELKRGDKPETVETMLKMPGFCPHLVPQGNGKYTCGVFDLRTQFPELFTTCNSFYGAKEGFVRNPQGRLVATSAEKEITFTLLQALLLPNPDSVVIQDMIMTTAEQIQYGVFMNLETSFHTYFTRMRAAYGSGLIPFYLEGYLGLYKKFKKDPLMMQNLDIIIEFLGTSGIMDLLAEEYEGLRSKIASLITRTKLSVSGGSKFFTKIAPFA